MEQQKEHSGCVEGLTVDLCQLREGFTTGACAAAAAKASILALLDPSVSPSCVDIPFPSGERFPFSVERVCRYEGYVESAVRKDAGDDPDITQGVLVVARVAWCAGQDILFEAGEGVGRVTKSGLSIPPGEPAINPGPRNMIRAGIRELTDRGASVTVSIPGGEELAKKTFNPRLGIVGGLSVLGTTGRVRPFSCQAIRCSVACELDVAKAAAITHPVLVPGHIGERSARRHLKLSEDQLIEVGNEWGFVLEGLSKYHFEHVLLWGHPGKLAKLADEEWDTHSSRSASAVEITKRLGLMPILETEPVTMEGLFEMLRPDEQQKLATELGGVISNAASQKCGQCCRISVGLVNMTGELLGSYKSLEDFQ
jgi:cobalt-precorrin-5B (C1)-methyltransferase